MHKDDKRYIIETASKALIAFIPGIGGPIGSILNDALADRKAQRIDGLLRQLKDEFYLHCDEINETFIKHDDFLDLLETTLTRVAGERSEVKREAYKNILVSSVLSYDKDFDDAEYQIRILDQLMFDHIYLLKLFNSPSTVIDQNNIKESTYLKLFRKILPNWDKDYFFDHIRDLENLRLIELITPDFQTMTSGLTLESLNGKLTSKGATFVNFILR